MGKQSVARERRGIRKIGRRATERRPSGRCAKVPKTLTQIREHLRNEIEKRGWTEEEKERIMRAELMCINSHSRTRRQSGEPYAVHPIRVAIQVLKKGGNSDAVVSALLHDVVEDEGVEIREIREKFGERVARIVAVLTKPKIVQNGESTRYIIPSEDPEAFDNEKNEAEGISEGARKIRDTIYFNNFLNPRNNDILIETLLVKSCDMFDNLSDNPTIRQEGKIGHNLIAMRMLQMVFTREELIKMGLFEKTSPESAPSESILGPGIVLSTEPRSLKVILQMLSPLGTGISSPNNITIYLTEERGKIEVGIPRNLIREKANEGEEIRAYLETWLKERGIEAELSIENSIVPPGMAISELIISIKTENEDGEKIEKIIDATTEALSSEEFRGVLNQSSPE